jgi:hypothetical protein
VQPTLSSIKSLKGAFEDSAFEISYSSLSKASKKSNDTEGFKIENIYSGTLQYLDNNNNWIYVDNNQKLILSSSYLNLNETIVTSVLRYVPSENMNGNISIFTAQSAKSNNNLWNEFSASTLNVTASIKAVNDAPVFNIDTLSLEFQGNQTGVVYKANATDIDSNKITYSLAGTDAKLFKINKTTGDITFAKTPDAQKPLDANKDNLYELNIIASDGKLHDNISTTIKVTNSFTQEYLNAKTFYQVILDTQDDNNNGSTSDHIVIAMKYENSKRLIDFNVSDNIDNFIDAGNYTISNGALTVNDIDGGFETDAIVSINAIQMTTTSSYSWNESSQTTDWYFDINDAWLSQLRQTKMFTQDFFDSVNLTYSIFKDSENNYAWTGAVVKFSNGYKYQVNGFDSSNPTSLHTTYTITSDGRVREDEGTGGSSSVWYDGILAVTNDYILVTDGTNSQDNIGYVLLDAGKAREALHELQINGVISGDLTLI